MSDTLRWETVHERVTGKWQIPALALAMVTFGASVVTYRSPIDKIPFDDIRDGLFQRIEDGLYTTVIDTAGQLLLLPGKTPEDLAGVHAALGRARLMRARRSGVRSPSIGRAVIAHYEAAAEGGFEIMPLDHEVLGWSHDFQGNYATAIAHFDAAISLMDDPGLDLRWHVAKRRADYAIVDERRSLEELDGLIRDATGRPDILTWSVERKIDLLMDGNRRDDATALLASVSSRMEGAWAQWHDFLDAYVLYRSRDYEEAESRLRHLRDGLETRDELYARTGWLLGRVVLGREGPERPEEALSFFREVASRFGGLSVFGVASELGMAESLVLLERFDDALERYKIARDRMKGLPPSRHLNRAVIEASLTVLSERLQREGRLEASLAFAREALLVDAKSRTSRRPLLLERASDLLTALARVKREQAQKLEAQIARTLKGEALGASKPTASDESLVADWRTRSRDLRSEARRMLLEAADASNEIVALHTMDEQRAEAAAWRAAERVHESGDLRATLVAMDEFIRRRPESPFVARALRFRGEAQQSLGQYADAVESYRENLQRFPRSVDSGSSLIPMARCFIAMGKASADQAEKTLRLILDDSDVFTPQAPEYADALFLLGDLLNRIGAFERAIPTLEEAMHRYPNDARNTRTRFLLGDCYRQSGLALKQDYNDASFAAERERIVVEQRERLRTAAALFERTVADFEKRDLSGMPRLDQVYLQHARLYQADCYFELGEYEDALAKYERAAWIYKGTTTALAAYVQIVNCHVFLGNEAEAAAALRRALYMVDTMPDEVFAGDVELESRQDWRDYFAWVEQTRLF